MKSALGEGDGERGVVRGGGDAGDVCASCMATAAAMRAACKGNGTRALACDSRMMQMWKGTVSRAV
jgi:hypothetical protein